jgi:hypothetical protein
MCIGITCKYFRVVIFFQFIGSRLADMRSPFSAAAHAKNHAFGKLRDLVVLKDCHTQQSA